MIKETEHFISHYHTKDENLAEQFIALLEEKYQKIHKDFGFERNLQKYEFWICKDADEYIEKTGKTKEEYQSWMVGNSNLEKHTITILSPNVIEDHTLQEMEKVAVHELVHMIFDDATKVAEDDVEGWIAEGIAILYSEQTDLDYVSLSDYPLIADISGDFDNFVDNCGYDYAGIYVWYFIEKYGFERFISVYSGQSEVSERIYSGFETESIEAFVRQYTHPENKEIKTFIEIVIGDEKELKAICNKIFSWIDKNVSYSRLNAPFYPLQRSDLDVLEMKSGTCGDYSNLIVSVFLALGFEAGYAYVHKDCFGDEQDHICAAVKEHERWILIDATNPYRKWCGFDCQHQAYELLLPDEFEKKMKREDTYWTSVADTYGKKKVSGLWYAPWIHEEVVVEKEGMLDSVFFLLIMGENAEATLYAYYQHYTEHGGVIPCMMTMSGDTISYQFSVYEAKSIWDNEQWSESYLFDEVPKEFQTKEFNHMRACVEKVRQRIDMILEEANKE